MNKITPINKEVKAKLSINLGTGEVTSTIPGEPRSIDEIRGQLRAIWFMFDELRSLEQKDDEVGLKQLENLDELNKV
jgi:hypothetical protein